ncbi:MAG TPA: hypothetical protein DHN29_20360, partial [Cytophagales bacterium]|nr:hypothetical protein [Cytophagales bacterium]
QDWDGVADTCRRYEGTRIWEDGVLKLSRPTEKYPIGERPEYNIGDGEFGHPCATEDDCNEGFICYNQDLNYPGIFCEYEGGSASNGHPAGIVCGEDDDCMFGLACEKTDKDYSTCYLQTWMSYCVEDLNYEDGTYIALKDQPCKPTPDIDDEDGPCGKPKNRGEDGKVKDNCIPGLTCQEYQESGEHYCRPPRDVYIGDYWYDPNNITDPSSGSIGSECSDWTDCRRCLECVDRSRSGWREHPNGSGLRCERPNAMLLADPCEPRKGEGVHVNTECANYLICEETTIQTSLRPTEIIFHEQPAEDYISGTFCVYPGDHDYELGEECDPDLGNGTGHCFEGLYCINTLGDGYYTCNWPFANLQGDSCGPHGDMTPYCAFDLLCQEGVFNQDSTHPEEGFFCDDWIDKGDIGHLCETSKDCDLCLECVRGIFLTGERFFPKKDGSYEGVKGTMGTKWDDKLNWEQLCDSPKGDKSTGQQCGCADECLFGLQCLYGEICEDYWDCVCDGVAGQYTGQEEHYEYFIHRDIEHGDVGEPCSDSRDCKFALDCVETKKGSKKYICKNLTGVYGQNVAGESCEDDEGFAVDCMCCEDLWCTYGECPPNSGNEGYFCVDGSDEGEGQSCDECVDSFDCGFCYACLHNDLLGYSTCEFEACYDVITGKDCCQSDCGEESSKSCGCNCSYTGECEEGLTCTNCGVSDQYSVCARGGGFGEGLECTECKDCKECACGFDCVDGYCACPGCFGSYCFDDSNCKNGLICHESEECPPGSGNFRSYCANACDSEKRDGPGQIGDKCGSNSACEGCLRCVNGTCGSAPNATKVRGGIGDMGAKCKNSEDCCEAL